MNKHSTACFTGHRPDKLGGYNGSEIEREVRNELRTYIYKAIQAGYDTFISGMAIGVDTWASECVLEAKELCPDIKLICAIPFTGQEKCCPEESQKNYWRIIDQADEVHIISDKGYAPYKMQKRNEWMVDNSSYVIGVWDGSNGGTKNCINYAKKKKVSMVIIDPTKLLE